MIRDGNIIVSQQGEAKAKRGWLRATFRVKPWACIEEKYGCTVSNSVEDAVVDLKKPPPFKDYIDRAKELLDAGKLINSIAAELGVNRNQLTKELRSWHKSHGEKMPDGRSRRAKLKQKNMNAPLYEQKAEEAKILCDQGLSDLQIAKRLKCSTTTVEAAIAYWHTSRGLPAPTHKDRRNALIDRVEMLYKSNTAVNEIASAVGICSRSVTVLLKERHASRGESLPDGRTRRFTEKAGLDGGPAASGGG